jgi:addiction module HigA family antidote
MSLDRDFYAGNAPPHPGEILRDDILPALGLSRAKVATHLGIAARMLGDLLRERRPVTLEIARRLGAAFGSGTHYWLGLQIQHDLWVARTTEPSTVKPLYKVPQARRSHAPLV